MQPQIDVIETFSTGTMFLHILVAIKTGIFRK
ncbi:hypothetical protein M5D96_002711 [Drosophila gunungcola]|uniref:Uncharacterized protein n=1 Tax=Drosophila gunungcola TaxID=103775 RepID=A0A9P9Z0I9_9MUSC|nr:hypothetical protein M5D96_002711 [Drosophila gunungcola]